MVIREGRGSVSLLQRALGIGYGRAARLIDFMAEDGIVGPYNGSQAREILMSLEQWEQMTAGGGELAAPAAPTKPARGNRIVLPPAESARQPARRSCRPARSAPSNRCRTRRSTDDEFEEFNEETKSRRSMRARSRKTKRTARSRKRTRMGRTAATKMRTPSETKKLGRGR